MFPPVPAVTRRRLLLGATAIPLVFTTSGCTQDPPVELPVDPDRAALQSALETEAALSSLIESWTPAIPDDRRVALLVVDAHVEALAVALGSGAAATETPSAAPTASAREVQRSIDSAADLHTRALRTIGPRVSPLVAAIAASDAALGASLRGQRP